MKTVRAYSESYVNEIVETQGKLFESIKYKHPGIDVRHFIEYYMRSKTRGYLDKAHPYVSNMNEDELLEYFMKIDNYSAKIGRDIGGFIPNWIGQFYAYYQWYYNVSSKVVIEMIPVERLISSYNVLHDMDLQVAVEKVGLIKNDLSDNI